MLNSTLKAKPAQSLELHADIFSSSLNGFFNIRIDTKTDSVSDKLIQTLILARYNDWNCLNWADFTLNFLIKIFLLF